MISGTCQLIRLSWRKSQMRALWRGAMESGTMYCASHCFTLMPTEAAARLRTKARNQRALMITSVAVTGCVDEVCPPPPCGLPCRVG